MIIMGNDAEFQQEKFPLGGLRGLPGISAKTAIPFTSSVDTELSAYATRTDWASAIGYPLAGKVHLMHVY